MGSFVFNKMFIFKEMVIMIVDGYKIEPGSDLTMANLEGANLKGASLMRANLEWASLRGANLKGARYDDETIWPKGFDPVKAGAVKLQIAKRKNKRKDRPVQKSVLVSLETKGKLEVLYRSLGISLGDIVDWAVKEEYDRIFDDNHDLGEKVTIEVKLKSPRVGINWEYEGEVVVIKKGGE